MVKYKRRNNRIKLKTKTLRKNLMATPLSLMVKNSNLEKASRKIVNSRNLKALLTKRMDMDSGINSFLTSCCLSF